MTATVYDQTHVRLQELLGRTYNNPLGETPFPLLQKLVGASGCPLVLDAGCGRGQTSRWWAVHAGATVDAFDPSPTMLDNARRMVTQQSLENQIRLHQTDIASFSSGSKYDLVIAHDVLCYSEKLRPDLRHLLDLLRVGGVASLTSYHGETASDETQAVVKSWGIQPPRSFQETSALLDLADIQVLLFVDTTRQYGSHWGVVREILATRLAEARRVVGREETDAFAGQIEAILSAVCSGRFGHWWAILVKTN